MKEIRVHIWLAAASLHEAGHGTFTSGQLAMEVEKLFQDTRPGVKTHITAHANASARKATAAPYNYLFRVARGQLRLCRQGDEVHPSRVGAPLWPDQAEIDPEYWSLWRKWSAWQAAGVTAREE